MNRDELTVNDDLLTMINHQEPSLTITGHFQEVCEQVFAPNTHGQP